MSKQDNLDLRRVKALEESNRTFADIYRIMFSEPEHVICEGEDGFRTYRYTFGQLDARCRKAAAALYAKLGAEGRYIALELENSPEWIVAFWAILMSGNKPYLVNLRHPRHLTEGILKTLHIDCILSRDLSTLPGTKLLISELEEGEFPAVPESVFADEFALSTSATTMKETVCFYSGRQVAAQIVKIRTVMKGHAPIIKSGKNGIKILAFLPFYHIFGLFATYFWYAFFSGRTLVFLRDYSADTITKTCRRHEVTHIFAVPMLWHTVENQVWASVRRQGEKKEKQLRSMLRFTTALQNISPCFGRWLARRLLGKVTGQLFGTTLICCISGGSYIRDSALELFNGLGYCMLNGYGMSETGITSVEMRSRPKNLNKNAIGRPFEGLEYRIDENNVLLIRGDNLCTRKLIDGQEQITPEWFETGDIVEKDAAGCYYIKGRKGDVVIGESGENINPDSLEQLFTLESVTQLCVLGLPGNNGEELSMVVRLSPYASEATVSKIRDRAYAINTTLPKTTAVQKFYFTSDDLAPPTAIKISRTQLKKKISEGQVKLTAFRDFQRKQTEDDDNPVLQQVKVIIAKHLEIEPEQVETNAHIFYDLGATSIQYFTIFSEITAFFGVGDFNNADGYRYTPKEICEYLERYL